ncbi:DUF6470 family protein [Clostridiaceae bacterium 35-E11]
MDLRITATPALINIKTTPGKLQIKQPQADINSQIQPPKVQIHSEQAKVAIDQSQCFAESGLKSVFQLGKEWAAQGIQQAFQGIGRIAAQGDELAAIETGGNPISKQALENAFLMYEKNFNIGLMPKSRPKIEFTGGTVDIKVIPGEIRQNVKINKPQIQYTRGNVEVYLKQKNSIKIEYVGRRLNVGG